MRNKNILLQIEKFTFVFLRILLPLLALVCLPIKIFLLIHSSNNIDNEQLEFFLNKNPMMFIFLRTFQNTNFIIGVLLGIVIFIQILRFFQSRNKGRLFNSNGKIYYDFPFFVYWISAKILGFDKVQLAGLPIWMQYKLILRNTFSQILCDSYGENLPNDESEINVKIRENDSKSGDVLIIVEDTYEVPEGTYDSKRFKKVISIQKCKKFDGVRTINSNLINEVKKRSYECSKTHNELYLILTTSPHTNYRIANEVYRQFGRFGFDKIFIYQMDKNKQYSKKYRIV